MYELIQKSLIDPLKRGDETMQSSHKPVPPIAQALTTDFGWRHVKGVTVTRTLAAIWLVALGTFF
ncbi:MAG: hypothetical protein ACRDNS_22280, partial [Trebonia sp.]